MENSQKLLSKKLKARIFLACKASCETEAGIIKSNS